jgi:DNA-binding NarL/FixJ family response regulator
MRPLRTSVVLELVERTVPACGREIASASVSAEPSMRVLPVSAALAPGPAPRVALALPDVLLSDALAFALRDKGFKVSICTSRKAGPHASGRADMVIVLDPSLDALGCCAQLEELRAGCDSARVVAITTEVSRPVARAVVRYRLDGLILRSRPLSEAVDVLRSVSAGSSVFPPGLTTLLHDDETRTGGLSDRQREVLALLSAGHSNAEIAARLHISLNTVKFHVRVIYERLGVNSRVAAAAYLHTRSSPVYET